MIAKLTDLGLGETTNMSELPPRRAPWWLDCDVFSVWKRLGFPVPFPASEFPAEKYERGLAKLRALLDTGHRRPDFLAVPDLPAGGLESLRCSLSWVERLKPLGCPLYLVVQDGMGAEVEEQVLVFDGLLVGGTPAWKLRTGAAWVEMAHRNGLRCHIGRVGTAAKVRWARSIDADSIDSSLPLFSRANLARFLSGFSDALTAPLEFDPVLPAMEFPVLPQRPARAHFGARIRETPAQQVELALESRPPSPR